MDRFQAYLRDKGTSDQQRANRLGMSRSMVNKLLAGNLSWPLLWLLANPAAAVALARDSIERLDLAGMSAGVLDARDQAMTDLIDLQGGLTILQAMIAERIAASQPPSESTVPG